MYEKTMDKKKRKYLFRRSAVFVVLMALILMSCTAKTAYTGKTAYLKLTKPDRISVYGGDSEQIFTEGEQKYSEIYESIKKSWNASEKSMVQLLYLDKESTPEESSRIVFEYDTPIRWRISPTSEASEAEVNTYIFFLSEEWTMGAAVICKDGDYEKKAFFPVMDIRKDELLQILEK